MDPDRRTFKCFGCGAGGDIFTWLEKREGLEPREALHVLAERAGIELTRRPPAEREREQRLLAAHDTAHFYFRQALRGTEAGRAAAEYLAKRGVAQQSIERFGLGYAPDDRDGLLRYLRKKGYSDDEAIAAGLVIETERGLFDRFRDRLMVPIRDGRGRIIAFGGRAMHAGQPAKYVNSPQTLLFNKSATLYALDVAKTAIRKAREAVIVEGYFDVIACHQAGLENAVASMGTALTTEQYAALDGMRLDREAGEARAIVAFDADPAGRSSAEGRGIELLHSVRRHRERLRKGELATRTGLPVHVALLPEGDPDELARSDPARLRSVLSAAPPVLEFVLDRVRARSDLEGPEGRQRFLADALPLVAEEPDPFVKEGYLGLLVRLTGVPHEVLRAEAVTAPPKTFRPAPAAGGGPASSLPSPAGTGSGTPGNSEAPAPPAETKQIPSLERFLMAQLLLFPEEAARLELDPDDLVDPDHREIYLLLRSGGRPGPGLPAHLATALAALGASAQGPVGEDQAARAIGIAALRLREENLRRRLGEARAALARASGGDVGGLDAEVIRLAEELDRVMRAKERQTVLRGEARPEEG